MILRFLLGVGIGYALARVILYSYMKWQEKHKSSDIISHEDILHSTWKYSIYYGVLLVIIPIKVGGEVRPIGLVEINLIWLGLVVLEEYLKRGKRQLKLYEEEIRKGKDLPIEEMSISEINFWIQTLTKDKKKLEKILKNAKKNNFKKIIKNTEKNLKNINNDLEALTIAKIKKKS